MKVIDLFASVGGGSLGFEKAGFNIVWAVELDEKIANSYKKIIQNLMFSKRTFKKIYQLNKQKNK